MKMSVCFLLTPLVCAMVAPAYAGQSPKDAYTACLIGNAVIERYNGVDRSAAVARAWTTCVSLKASLDPGSNVLEIYDFVYSVLRQMPEPSIELGIPGVTG